MKVVIVEPLMEPYAAEISGDLSSLQEVVGGHIETVYPFSDHCVIFCNDEGKFDGSLMNRALRDEDGKIYDVICGPFLIVGTDGPEICSLTEQQTAWYMEVFKEPELFRLAGREIEAIPLREALEERMKLRQEGVKDVLYR